MKDAMHSAAPDAESPFVSGLMQIRNSLALREVLSARWAGVSFSVARATFSGRLVEPDPQSEGPFYRFNLVERQVYPVYISLAARHSLGVRRCASPAPRWLVDGVCRVLLSPREIILEQRLEMPSLRAVITTSEKVTTEMRRVMESAYGCRVYEEYGTFENALFASDCEAGRLHVSPDAGIVELLNSDGSPCGPDEVGEVVATCLNRDYQPLIRFRLGEFAQWASQSCECGRAMPVLKEVVGRVEDVVTGPDGRQMVRFHGIFVDQPHVREGQIIQETLHRIRVKIVPLDGFGPRDIDDIVGRVRQRLGPQVEMIVETLAEIPRTAAGKFRAVVSEVEPWAGPPSASRETRS